MTQVRATTRCAAVALLALAGLGARAHAQDFTTGLPPALCAGLSGGRDVAPSVALEHGLPGDGRPAIEASFTSWLGVPGLTTRALAAGIGFGTVRAACGVSRTGVEPFGWDAAGAALGAVGERAGAAVRAIGRREDDGETHPRAVTGAEVGAGAWVRAGAGARVWAEAPQVWTRGSPPPLPRSLAIGVVVESDGVAAWLQRTSPARALEATGQHEGGIAVDMGPARVWLEARERPLRAAFGLQAAIRGVAVRVRAEAHPVLGETVTIVVGTARGGAR